MRQSGEFIPHQHFAECEISPDVFGTGEILQFGTEQTMNHDHGVPSRSLVFKRLLHHITVDGLSVDLRILIRPRIGRTGIEKKQGQKRKR